MRPALAATALLCACFLPTTHARDMAYVDGVKLPDPARVDGSRGGDSARNAQAYAAEAEARTHAEELAETQRQIQQQTAQIVAAAQQAAAQQAAQAPQGVADSGPPIGGNDMLAAFGRARDPMAGQPAMPAPAAGAGVRSQIGSALVQDAAGVVDAHIQREVGGRNDTVIYPGAAPAPSPGW